LHLRQLATAPPSTATLVTTRTMSCTLRSLARTPYLVRVARSGTCRTILHSRVASKLWATSLSLACRSPSVIYLTDARTMLKLWASTGRWKKLDSTRVVSLYSLGPKEYISELNCQHFTCLRAFKHDYNRHFPSFGSKLSLLLWLQLNFHDMRVRRIPWKTEAQIATSTVDSAWLQCTLSLLCSSVWHHPNYRTRNFASRVSFRSARWRLSIPLRGRCPYFASLIVYGLSKCRLSSVHRTEAGF